MTYLFASTSLHLLLSSDLAHINSEGEVTRLLWGVEKTPENGKVKISLQVDPSEWTWLRITDVTNLAFRVHASKESGSDNAKIQHTYLCDYETMDCVSLLASFEANNPFQTISHPLIL